VVSDALIRNIGWEGEVETDLPYRRLVEFQNAIREGRHDDLFGIGANAGKLALFATPHTFGPSGPKTYLMKPIAPAPFAGRDYRLGSDIPAEVKGRWAHVPIESVDPRGLVATQPSITHQALSHYLGEGYPERGELFDRSRDASNDAPIVVHFQRGRYLLSGHHRATAALLTGQHFPARVVYHS
jgi:hypothetical protein